MFASPYSSSPGSPRNPHAAHRGGLYQQVGVETRLSGASPHQLVAMLFDGFMEAVTQARGAMRARDALAKCTAIGRAVRILDDGLRAGLDLRAPGTLAQDLDELYTYLSLRLTVANMRNDEAALDECQRLVKPLQDAWLSIAASTAASPSAGTAAR